MPERDFAIRAKQPLSDINARIALDICLRLSVNKARTNQDNGSVAQNGHHLHFGRTCKMFDTSFSKTANLYDS